MGIIIHKLVCISIGYSVWIFAFSAFEYVSKFCKPKKEVLLFGIHIFKGWKDD